MALLIPDSWLTRVLTSGAEKFTAAALWYGTKTATIYESLIKRFGIPAPHVFNNLLEFSESMVTAGELAAQLPPGKTLTRDLIPVNPFLFGDEPAGRRELWRTRIYVPETGRWVYLDINTPDEIPFSELEREAENEALRRIGKSPGAFGVPGDEVNPLATFEIIFGEARF